jgi:K+/H+ antiporter YhaU regulatory subunit KhtT
MSDIFKDEDTTKPGSELWPDMLFTSSTATAPGLKLSVNYERTSLVFHNDGRIELTGDAQASQDIINLLLRMQRQVLLDTVHITQAIETLNKHFERQVTYIRQNSPEIEEALKSLTDYAKLIDLKA